MKYDLNEDLKIDELNLHEEMARHSQKAKKYYLEYARLKKVEFRLKEQLTLKKAQYKRDYELTRANVESEVRTSDPQEHGVEKFTEATVQNIVNRHPDNINAYNLYIDKVEEVVTDLSDVIEKKAVMKGACVLMEQNKGLLEALTRIFLSGYYSDNTVEPRIQQEKDTGKRRVQTKMLRTRKGAK